MRDAHRARAARATLTPCFGLLEQNHLPLDGLADHLATTLVARQNGQIVGSAALEVYPDGALLALCRGRAGAAGAGTRPRADRRGHSAGARRSAFRPSIC